MVPLGQADLADTVVRWAAIQVRGDLIMVVFWGGFGGGGESQRNMLPCIEHVFPSYFVSLIANMNFIFIFPSHQRKGRATPTLFKFVLFL